MSTKLILHELTGSPNNLKARVALGYKGLDYESKPVDLGDSFPGNRSTVIKVSRQPRLPVLQHGNTVIFDSASILRYLEANFPDTPALFSEDHATHGEIEQWELFAKTQIGEVIGMMFGEALSPQPDTQVTAKANELLAERTGALEDKLSTSDFLVGDHLTAADIVCASPLYLADLTEKNAAAHPIAGFFRAHLNLADNRPKTRAWVRRVLAYDRVTGKR